MKYVGKVGVKVVPDTKEFRTTVQRLEAQRHKTVFDILVDARRAHAEQRAFDKKWNMKEIRRDVVADTKKAKAELKALMAGDGRKLLRVEVTDEALNATKAKIKALDDRLDRFRKYKVDTADTLTDLELANRELNRLEKARKVQLDVAQAKAKLESLDPHKVLLRKVKVDLEDAHRELQNLQNKIDRDFAEKKLNLELNVEKAQADLKALRAELKKATDEDHRVQILSNIKIAKQELADYRDELKRLPREKKLAIAADVDLMQVKHKINKLERDEHEVTFNADLDKGKAWTQIKLLTRDRWIDLHVRLTKSSVARVKTMLKGLTGVNMLEKFRDKFENFIGNLDTMAIKLAAFGPVLGYIGSMLIGVLPAILNFLHGIVLVAPVMLAAVAMVGALGASVAVVAAAFSGLADSGVQDARKFYNAWTPIKQQFKDLGSTIKEGFFSPEMVNSMQTLANTVLPQLEAGFRVLSESIGETFTGVMDTFTKGLGEDRLKIFFAQLIQGTENARPGILGIFEGINNIGLAAGRFLPSIGTWISDIGERFKNWTSDHDKVNGKISEGARQFGLLKDAAKDMFSGLGGIMRAANDDAAPGFERFNEAMRKFKDFTNDPEIQTGLKNMFAGAREATDSLGAAFKDKETEISGFFTNIGELSKGLGTVFGDMSEGLVKALGSEDVKQGIKDLTEGLKEFEKSIDWEEFGRTVGSTLTLIGDMMKRLGPVVDNLIMLFGTLARFVKDDVMPFIQPVIDLFRDLIASIISVFDGVPNNFMDVLREHGGGIILGFIEGAQQKWEDLKNWFKGIIDWIIENKGPVSADREALIPAGRAVMEGFAEGLLLKWEEIAAWILEIPGKIKGFVSDAATWLVDAGTNLMVGFGEKIDSVFGTNIAPWMSGMQDKLRGFIADPAGTLQAKASDIITGFTSKMDSTFGTNTRSFVAGIPGRISGFLGDPWGTLQSKGHSIIAGFTSKMDSIFGSDTRGFIAGIPGRIAGFIGNPWGTLAGAGQAIMGGFRNSLASAFGGVKSFIWGILPWMQANKGPLTKDFKALQPAGKALMEGFTQSIEQAFQDTQRTVGEMNRWFSDTAFNDANFKGPNITYRAPAVVYKDELGTIDRMANISASEAAVIARAFAGYLAPELENELNNLDVKWGAGV